MKKLLFLLPIALTCLACENPNASKEKELIERELAVAKKELALKEKELQKHKSQASKTLVFTTKDLKQKPDKTLYISGRPYELDIVQKQTSDGNPPFSTQTTFVFTEMNVDQFEQASSLPILRINSAAGTPIAKDLNADGLEELIFSLSPGNGTWGSIAIYALNKQKKWQLVSSFSRWAFSECDAKVYWLPASQQLEIFSDQMTGEAVDCNKKEVVDWNID